MTDNLFPTNWQDWENQWAEWIATQTANGTATPTTRRIPGHNFMADRVLGTWTIGGRTVELSAVVFTAGETRRYVGITYADKTPIGVHIHPYDFHGSNWRWGWTSEAMARYGAPTGPTHAATLTELKDRVAAHTGERISWERDGDKVRAFTDTSGGVAGSFAELEAALSIVVNV